MPARGVSQIAERDVLAAAARAMDKDGHPRAPAASTSTPRKRARAGRLRHHQRPRRRGQRDHRTIPDAVLQQAHRRVRRLVREPGALLARDARAWSARRSATTARSRARFAIDTLRRRLGDLGIRADEEGVRLHRARRPPRRLLGPRRSAASTSSGARTPGPSRFRAENHQRDPGSRRSRPHTSKPVVGVGRFTDPDTMVEAIAVGPVRHHRRRPAVDRRPVPAEEDRGGPARRHPRVHRLQHLRLAL